MEDEYSANAARAAAEVTVQRRRRVSFPQEICFHETVRGGDVRELQNVLQEGGFDINSLSHCGVTALHQSALDGRLEIASLLISAGASLHTVCRDGWLPLHAAAAMGHVDIVEYFLALGVSPFSLTPLGETPRDLIEAEDEETRRVLLQAEQKVRKADRPRSSERRPIFRSREASDDSGLVLCDEDCDDEEKLRLSSASSGGREPAKSGRQTRGGVSMVRGSRVSESHRPAMAITISTEEVFL